MRLFLALLALVLLAIPAQANPFGRLVVRERFVAPSLSFSAGCGSVLGISGCGASYSAPLVQSYSVPFVQQYVQPFYVQPLVQSYVQPLVQSYVAPLYVQQRFIQQRVIQRVQVQKVVQRVQVQKVVQQKVIVRQRIRGY